MSSTPMRRFLGNLWEVLEVVLIAAGTVIIIRTFIAAPFQVSGASMESTLHDDEYLLIDELTYRFREPARGEIVVFKYPGDEREYFIKRIIALPHETIDIDDGLVTITTSPATGTPEVINLSEPYLDTGTQTNGEKHMTLSEDEYFVMGDNRANSFDSRNWGPLSKDEITGLVRARLFPLPKFTRFITPQYAY